MLGPAEFCQAKVLKLPFLVSIYLNRDNYCKLNLTGTETVLTLGTVYRCNYWRQPPFWDRF
jgi:hypothetical protein